MEVKFRKNLYFYFFGKGIYMVLELDDALAKKLSAICGMTGEEVPEVVRNCLCSYMARFCGRDGVFAPEKAVMTFHSVAPEGVREEKKKCYVLSKGMSWGKEYYSVYCEGGLFKVPAGNVKFVQQEEEEA